MEPGARGILELLCRSERCMGDQGLEMKGFPNNPQTVEITLREWILMDPAFEFRCFINRDQLRGVSQAGPMGVYGVHYPQLLARKGGCNRVTLLLLLLVLLLLLPHMQAISFATLP